MFGGLFFFEFLIPLYFGGCNFLISNSFSIIVSVSNAQEEGFKFCSDTRNNKDLPLDPTCLECLIVQSLVNLP